MSSTQEKFTRHTKKQENMIYNQEKNKWIENPIGMKKEVDKDL